MVLRHSLGCLGMGMVMVSGEYGSILVLVFRISRYLMHSHLMSLSI